MDEGKVTNKCILEINDEVNFVTKVAYIIAGIVGITFVKLPIMLEISQTQNQIGHLVSAGALFSGVFGVISYLRNKEGKIKFNNNNINKNLNTLNLEDIKEVYKVSFLFILETEYGVRRFNLLSRLILILLLPILGTLYILNVFFKTFYYRKKVLHNMLVIIGKNDKQIILVQLPLKDKEIQKELEEYCKKYLNTDIKTLKTRFFIPNDEKWFIETK